MPATSHNQYLVEYSALANGEPEYNYWIALSVNSQAEAVASFRRKHSHLENLKVHGCWTRYVPEKDAEG